jgi:hypothetical protein
MTVQFLLGNGRRRCYHFEATEGLNSPTPTRQIVIPVLLDQLLQMI